MVKSPKHVLFEQFHLYFFYTVLPLLHYCSYSFLPLHFIFTTSMFLVPKKHGKTTEACFISFIPVYTAYLIEYRDCNSILYTLFQNYNKKSSLLYSHVLFHLFSSIFSEPTCYLFTYLTFNQLVLVHLFLFLYI